jgi:acyl-CoA synthetase (AMP-forming)/AMP-acid ligase II
MPVIAAGASLVLRARFSATDLWAELSQAGATVLHATHSLLLMALSKGDPPHLKLRTIIASWREEAANRLTAALPGAHLITVYGLTECPLATLGARDGAFRPGWVGYPYGSRSEFRIVDASNRRVVDGIDGEIQIRNAGCATGYVDRPSSDLLTSDGWLTTGDLGHWSDGGLYLTGRKKEMIRRGGENISQAEVEEALCLHPLVVEAAVVAHPDTLLGEAVRAFVEPTLGADLRPEDLHSFLQARLARFKLPRYFDVVPAIPRTSSNKPDKPRLLREFPEPQVDLGMVARKAR